MKVQLILPPPAVPPSPDVPSSESESDQLDFELSLEKLALGLGITFAFILLLLLSLICIFYFMGFLQNVFGYSWAAPMGRTYSSPTPPFYFEDGFASSPVPSHRPFVNQGNSVHHPQMVRCPSSHSNHRVPIVSSNCAHAPCSAIQSC